MSLHRFLTRLIWLCVLPLVALAAYLAFDRVQGTQAEIDLKAANMARNYATAVDQNLSARIGALHMLAISPLADAPALRRALYEEARGFHDSFGSHVILADLDMRMLFNTREPFGAALPRLPRPKGQSAAATALATGKPAVGDTFIGPVARELMVAIAVPGLRQEQVAYLVLATFEAQQFQKRLELLALPSGWSLSLVDGQGKVIARRAPPGLDTAADVDAAGRFVVASAVSSWSVVLEIPRNIYRAPLIAAAVQLAIAILGVTLAGVLGGMLASRRLGRAVASLAQAPAAGTPAPDVAEIAEIAAVRRLLDDSMQRRLAAENAQHQSEHRFRATFEQAAVGIALVAPDGRWIRVNRKLCDIVGYSNDELLALSFQDITHPDDLDTDLIYMQQILAGEIPTYALEKRYRHKDGSIVWINLTVALVRHADGRPDYFISVIEDIRRRKEAEALLQMREASLREAQRLAGLGSWSWDLGSGRHTWSEEIYRIYGRDPALGAAVYPEVQQYFTPESWARLAAAVETGLARGEAYECDAEVVRADGSHRWITARGEAMRDANGTVLELRGTVQDITECMQAAEALRQLNASLEQRVEQRTAELTAVNKELDTFAYTVSHDLRAPLRAMKGFVQALIEDAGPALDEEARNDLGQIEAAGHKMEELIEGILALSRSSRGHLQRDRVDLTALAAGILADLRHTEPERRVNQHIEAGLTLCGDARMAGAVMRNLLGNAWKYTARVPTAEIRVYRGEVDGLPGICVADNGAGFDMAHAGQLFHPFRRLHRQDEFPGIGIGLATVHRIVDRHGGHIRAQGAPGRGATFCFTLAGEEHVP